MTMPSRSRCAARVASMTVEIGGGPKHHDDRETWRAPPCTPDGFRVKADLAGLPRLQSVNSPPTHTRLPPSTRQHGSHLSRHLNHQQRHCRAHITANLDAGLTSDDRVDRSPSVAFHASQVLINKHDSKCPMTPLHSLLIWT